MLDTPDLPSRYAREPAPNADSESPVSEAILTAEEVAAWPFDGPLPGGRGAAQDRMRARLHAHGQWHPNQYFGRRAPIGCVALEITQRCNLDCTLCYLSESAEAVKDLPLDVLFRRIDQIAET